MAFYMQVFKKVPLYLINLISILKLLKGEFSFLNLKVSGKLGSKFLLTVDLKSIIEIESIQDYERSLSKNEKIFENNCYFLFHLRFHTNVKMDNFMI